METSPYNGLFVTAKFDHIAPSAEPCYLETELTHVWIKAHPDKVLQVMEDFKARRADGWVVDIQTNSSGHISIKATRKLSVDDPRDFEIDIENLKAKAGEWMSTKNDTLDQLRRANMLAVLKDLGHEKVATVTRPQDRARIAALIGLDI